MFDQLSLVNLLRDNNTLTKLHPQVASIRGSQQSTAAVHDCSTLHQGWWSWQRLTAPKNDSLFQPNTNALLAPFPPAAYRNLPDANKETPFFRGAAACIAPAALKSTDEARDAIMAGLKGPPGQNQETDFRRAMQEVLQQSGSLDDAKKVIAECECSACCDIVSG